METVNALALRATAEARAGRTAEARATMRQAETLAAAFVPAPLHSAVYVAEAYAALHDAGRAIGWLRRYESAADLHFQLHLRCDPPLDPVAHDARFRALLTRPRSGNC